MSMNPEDKAVEIIAAANKLVADVQRELEEAESMYRQHGIDPAKLRSYVDGNLSAEDKAKAEALVKADLDAVEDEASQAKLHAAHAESSGRIKRPKSMV
ncbi:hypothetical protein [Chitinimonas lacunae]|uniref:Uncharacterized protein n=1 Tax=Chitinimonas lacunae TaxID=1963018 RepID=A0ABV8MQ55_9NEIS